MADARRCPHCGTELPIDAPQALCPRCLLQAGFASGEARADERLAATESHLETPFPRFVPPTPAELASRFPQLEFLELIGQGGMGAVYKARQPALDRLVAVKVLPPDAGGDAAFAERFAREARAMARLSHPHIVNVYDFGQAEGQFYLVMEYVDGVNLRQAIRAKSVPSQTALMIVTQVCEALQYAHDEGVVHRDIKPENILLDARGRVKIADFGLAKLLGAGAAATELTGTQQVMGTIRYMAPEQMEGARDVDHRADIYSLGVVFYELLTGEAPMGRFQPPSAKVEVDVRIDEVVLKSLEREPARRYQHASDVKSDIESIVGSRRATGATVDEPFASAARGKAVESQRSPAAGSAASDDQVSLAAPAAGMVVVGTFLTLVLALGIWGKLPQVFADWWVIGLGGPLLVLGGVVMNQHRHYWLAFVASLVCLLIGFATLWFVFFIFLLPLIFLLVGGLSLWRLMQRAVRAEFASNAARQPARNQSRDVARAESQLLLAEPAESRPPFGFGVAATGLFTLGWFASGALRNWSVAGVAAGTALMALLVFAVLRWKLKYIPRLESEIARQSSTRLRAALGASLALFVGGMLAVNEMLPNLWDWMQIDSVANVESAVEQLQRNGSISALDLSDAQAQKLGASTALYRPRRAHRDMAIADAVAAFLLLASSVFVAVGTRTLQHSWPYHWRPTLAVTLLAAIALPLAVLCYVGGIRAVGESRGYGITPAQAWSAPPTIDHDEFRIALRDWAEERGFQIRDGQWGSTDGADIVSLVLFPRSSLDRIQATWSHVDRPQPPLGVTLLQAGAGRTGKAFVAIELPFAAFGSHEESRWQATVDDMMAAIAARCPGGFVRLETFGPNVGKPMAAVSGGQVRESFHPVVYVATTGLTIAAIALLIGRVWQFGAAANGSAPK